jgi:hypothetical protein
MFALGLNFGGREHELCQDADGGAIPSRFGTKHELDAAIATRKNTQGLTFAHSPPFKFALGAVHSKHPRALPSQHDHARRGGPM